MTQSALQHFNPHLIENVYSLDLAALWLYQSQAQSVRICTTRPELALAAARRLDWISSPLMVETAQIQESLENQLGLKTNLGNDNEADAALVPFSRDRFAQPPPARTVVVLGHNALSYKSLRNPFALKDTAFSTAKWLQQTHQITHRAGLLTPEFVARWAVSLIAGPRYPETHFRQGQKAMDNIYRFSRLWWYTGYVVVLAGQLGGEQ